MSWPEPSDSSECEVHSSSSGDFVMTMSNGYPKKHRTAERIKVFRQWLADMDEDEKKLFIRELLLPREFRLCSAEAESLQLQSHTSECGTIRWKDAFSERYRLWRNWHAGRCVVRTFTGHTQGITCVQFDDDRIVSGSSDTTIRIWDLRGSSDVGNLGTMALNGHSATVRCLDLNGNVLASGSNDFSIKIWNVDVNPRWSSIGCRKTMLGHSNYVRCLQMDHECLISGSYDMHLKLWSLNTGACTRTLMWVTCVRFDDQRIVSGSVDRMIKMWDVRTGKCMHTIDWKLAEGHTGVVRCLQVDTWRIVSAADDRTIKVWNVDSLQRLCTLHSHEDGVTCVQFSDRQIVSGSYDKTVKLWDFSRF
uniref:WD_REPEATS_REGION domain-containing protein n=1 Tax=Angiostrongylus cantonensis TaxID=6313 RepID=A0A158P8E4_ANGCA